MRKLDYTKAYRKKIIQDLVFDDFKSRGLSKIIGLAGPNITDYLTFAKSKGIKQAEIYEKDSINLLYQIADFRPPIKTKVLYQDKVNIMEAIANSGDITVTGDRKDVKVIRRYPQGSETFSIDLTDSNATSSPCFYLQPNDYIYVKPLKQKTWGTGKTGIESLTTLITLLSLATTTYLLLSN